MTKSGCCWHQYAEYKVKNNSPYPVRIVEEGLNASGLIWDCEEQTLVNGKMQTINYQILDQELAQKGLIMSFEFDNKKKMQLFQNENRLFYVFSNSQEHVELMQSENFNYSRANHSLSFTYKNTEYLISNDLIIAKTPTKAYTMKVVNGSRKGSLQVLEKYKLQNVNFQ